LDKARPAVGLPPAIVIAAGEVDTLALVRDPPPSLTLLRNADQTVSLSWTGVGALEQTENLTAPNWQRHELAIRKP
jgi:hypothetical protein